MKILVINAGSSSLKYQLLDMRDESVLCKGNCERIGIDGRISYKNHEGYSVTLERDFPTHAEAFQAVLHEIAEGEGHVVGSLSEISAIGHRVTHGGVRLAKSVLIDDSVIDTILEAAPLSPLHNPPQATTIRACRDLFGEKLPMVAVFDTAFHTTMPKKARAFAVPYRFYEEHNIRRFGFHGTSHRYVTDRAASLHGKMPERLITCHLGNGSSITAIRDGRVIDTSMGFSPLDGLLMGTRCGTIDASLVTYLMEVDHLSPAEINRVLNSESGLLGVSGVSSDFREVSAAAAEGNERAQLAVDMLEYQITKFCGSYMAALGGLDTIVFTGGIGENAIDLRRHVVENLSFLGITLDEAANSVRGEEIRISTPDSKVDVWVIPTNEELMIARDTAAFVKAEN